MIISADADLLEIIGLSLRVSISAVLISMLIGFPLGALTAVTRFPGRQLIAIMLQIQKVDHIFNFAAMVQFHAFYRWQKKQI